jgi:hypothetical protein
LRDGTFPIWRKAFRLESLCLLRVPLKGLSVVLDQDAQVANYTLRWGPEAMIFYL